MCIYRRILNKSWTEQITNEEVSRRMGTGREVVRQFKTRKLQYLGHIMRHNSSQLQLIEEKIEGRISTDITSTNGTKYYQLKRSSMKNRKKDGMVCKSTSPKRRHFGKSKVHVRLLYIHTNECFSFVYM